MRFVSDRQRRAVFANMFSNGNNNSESSKAESDEVKYTDVGSIIDPSKLEKKNGVVEDVKTDVLLPEVSVSDVDIKEPTITGADIDYKEDRPISFFYRDEDDIDISDQVKTVGDDILQELKVSAELEKAEADIADPFGFTRRVPEDRRDIAIETSDVKVDSEGNVIFRRGYESPEVMRLHQEALKREYEEKIRRPVPDYKLEELKRELEKKRVEEGLAKPSPDSEYERRKQEYEKERLELEQQVLEDKLREQEIASGFLKSPSGFVHGLYEYGKRGFAEGAAKELGREAAGIGSGLVSLPGKAVMFPGRVVAETGRAAGGVVRGAGRTAEYVLAPGALAFGLTAGQGVTDIIAEAGDIIEAPKREFWMPPGTQKVWTGSKYETRQVLRPPLEPWAFNRLLGVQQPMGVSPTVSGVVPPHAADVSIYGAQRAQQLWGRDDIPVWGGLEMAAGTTSVPRVPMPDFFRMGTETIPKWIIPPMKREGERRSVSRSMPQLRGSPSIVAAKQTGSVPSGSSDFREVSKISPTDIVSKLPVQRFQKDIKPIRSPAISRNVSRVERSKAEFDDLSSALGASHPETKRAEAKMQSQADYALRHVDPGSYSELKLIETGLVPGVR